MLFLLYFSYLLIFFSFLCVLLVVVGAYFSWSVFGLNHASFAFFSSMVYSLAQSFVLFYIVGLTRATLNVPDVSNIKRELLIKNKSKNYSHTMLNVAIIGTVFIVGGAVDNNIMSPFFHGALSIIGLAHYPTMMRWQHTALKDCILTLKSIEDK